MSWDVKRFTPEWLHWRSWRALQMHSPSTLLAVLSLPISSCEESSNLPGTEQMGKWGEQLYPGSCSQFAGSSVSTTVASYVPSHWSSTAVSRLSLVIFPFHGENLRLMVVAECGQSLCKLPFGAQLSFLSQLKWASALHNLGSPEERSRIVPNCRQCNGKVGKR